MPRQKPAPPDRSRRHSVYVVYLRNPRGDGRAGYYVGMTGLSPEERFRNHKEGKKAAGVVRRHGVRLVPRLYRHLNPMTYEDAKAMEPVLAESLRKRGYQVFGGH
jgi:predicted GIY-YIG superfamily endonuclease